MPEYQTGVQQILPEGDYDFTVDDAGEKESSKGNPMIELQLKIGSVRVFDQLVFTRNAFWKIDQFRICTGDELVEGQKVNFEAEDCIDRKGRCHLYVDTYEGRSRNKVDAYLPPTDGESQPRISGGGSGGSEPDDISFASA
jgi:hypothetical protein